MDQAAHTVNDPVSMKGQWLKLFPNKGEVYLEIGSGKGQFISSLASKHTERNYIGVEGNQSVALRGMERAKEAQLKNIRIIPQYMKDPKEWFTEGELTGIYLNFSDPWSKDRHSKRRLSSEKFVMAYKDILSTGGFVEMKTDNEIFFNFSLKTMEEAGFRITKISRDLHKSQYAKNNILTEYEEKFSEKGLRINFFRAEKCDIITKI